MGKTNLIRASKVLLHFYLLVKENHCTIIKRKGFGLCSPKRSVVLWLNRIGNHYYKAIITVAAENLPSKLDLHSTAPTQLKGAICSSTHSLMCFFSSFKNVERLKECFIIIILLLVVEILCQEKLWKMCWELVFLTRYSFTEDSILESQFVISQHFSFHFPDHFMFK